MQDDTPTPILAPGQKFPTQFERRMIEDRDCNREVDIWLLVRRTLQDGCTDFSRSEKTIPTLSGCH